MALRPGIEPLSHALARPTPTPARTSLGKCRPRQMRLQATSVATSKAASTRYQRDVTAATAIANAKATLAWVLGKPAELPCGNHWIPNPSANGRGIASRCCPRRASNHALAIASKTRRTLWRMARLPTMNAPIVPATSSAGNCSVANSASLSTHSGDDADALSHRNSEWFNDAYDKVMADSKQAEDPQPLYKQAEEILAAEMPIIPLYHYANVDMISADIQGLPENNVNNTWYGKDLYRVAQ